MVDVANFPITPIFRSSVDSVNFVHKSRATVRECGELELDALECLQAYGARRAHKLCDVYVKDFKECFKRQIQLQRTQVMRRERIKQVLRGERKFMETLDPLQPPRDSYINGPFYN